MAAQCLLVFHDAATRLPVIVCCNLLSVLSGRGSLQGTVTFAERLRIVTKGVTAQRVQVDFRRRCLVGLGVATIWFRSTGQAPLKVEYAGLWTLKETKDKAVATKAVDFTEKWDSDHPTRCCEVGKTPIGKSFSAKLVKTTRKVVSKSEVNASNWECVVALAASAIACNMHAEL